MVSLIVFEVQQLLDSAMHDLITKMQSPGHCCLHTKIVILQLGLEVMIMSYHTVHIICISNRLPCTVNCLFKFLRCVFICIAHARFAFYWYCILCLVLYLVLSILYSITHSFYYENAVQ